MYSEFVKLAPASRFHYKVPRHWMFVDGFPMTVSSTVQKFKLREAAIAELGLAKAAAIRTA
jgi:fatty-acyl-CoA synthase